MDYKHIAIADVLKNKRVGLVSHQPDLTEPASDNIRVATIGGHIVRVSAKECEPASIEEQNHYWKSRNEPKTWE